MNYISFYSVNDHFLFKHAVISYHKYLKRFNNSIPRYSGILVLQDLEVLNLATGGTRWWLFNGVLLVLLGIRLRLNL